MVFSQKYNELNFDETVYKIKLSNIISLLKTRGRNYINETIDFLENDAGALLDVIEQRNDEINSLEIDIRDSENRVDSKLDEIDGLRDDKKFLEKEIADLKDKINKKDDHIQALINDMDWLKSQIEGYNY